MNDTLGGYIPRGEAPSGAALRPEGDRHDRIRPHPTAGGHLPTRPSVTRATRNDARRETPRISITGSDLTMLLSMSGLLGGVLGVVGLIELNS